MKYIDLLNQLNNLSEEQLDSEIMVIDSEMYHIYDQGFNFVINENPLFMFNDENNLNYYDFSRQEDADEYLVSEKIVDANKPIIIIN